MAGVGSVVASQMALNAQIAPCISTIRAKPSLEPVSQLAALQRVRPVGTTTRTPCYIRPCFTSSNPSCSACSSVQP